MEVYNENQLNSEESELSIEDAMKVNGTTNIPDVNLEDIEDATLDTETIGTFKIDDSMPEELKQQLIRFNQKTESLNNIISDFAQDTSSYKDLENTEYYDDSTADQVLLEVDDAIVEDDGISDSDVDNLF
ncbi:MAG: hypothetical protein PUG33_00740 [Mollicutes bacterium]|nr:hypothetical protein [Mollicutes bacterium]